MNLALWIAAGLLAAVALTGGITKTFVPKEKLAAAHGGAAAARAAQPARAGRLRAARGVRLRLR
jgi:hypothetical protein